MCLQQSRVWLLMQSKVSDGCYGASQHSPGASALAGRGQFGCRQMQSTGTLVLDGFWPVRAAGGCAAFPWVSHLCLGGSGGHWGKLWQPV